MPLTQTQLAAAVAEYSGLSRAQAKSAIDALEEVVLTEIGNAEKVKIGNLVQLTVRVKPPTKAREGRNPATGETIKIAAKPASVDVGRVCWRRRRPLCRRCRRPGAGLRRSQRGVGSVALWPAEPTHRDRRRLVVPADRYAYGSTVPEYVYELRRSDEIVATGRLSDSRVFEVGDEVEIVGWTGIVRDKLPTADPTRLRLIVQVRLTDDAS